MMKRTLTITLDIDWFYRRFGVRVVRGLAAVFAPLDLRLRRAALGFVNYFIASVFRRAGPDGMLARSPLAGGMVAWVLVLLAFYLLLNFL
jgi:multicomponent Na+:H+ antiporter subunit D